MLNFSSRSIQFGSFIARLVALLIGLSISLSAAAQPGPKATWDPDLSSQTGAENLYLAHQATGAVADLYVPYRFTEENSFGGKTLGVTYRFTRFLLLDFPLSSFTTVVQHEVFGHGTVARYGGQNATYRFDWPPPYGVGGGGTLSLPRNFHQRIHKEAAGMNANNLLAQTVRDNAVYRGQLGYQQALLNFRNQLTLPTSVWTTSSGEVGRDIFDYVFALSANEEFQLLSSEVTLDGLKSKAFASVLDPFFWISVRSVFYDYLWKGNSSGSVPMVNIGSVRYLPSTQLSLTPFGPEFLLEHLIRSDRRLWRVSTRWGNGPWGRFFGVGLESGSLLKIKRAEFGLRFAAWHQPEAVIDPDAQTVPSLSRQPGGQVELQAEVAPSSKQPVALTGAIGYKTSGFVSGERLNQGVLVDIGIRFSSESVLTSSASQ